MPGKTQYNVLEYRDARFDTVPVNAIREVPLTIVLNGREVVTLLCSGRDSRHLALGFLKSDAFVQHMDEVLDLTLTDHGDRQVARVEVAGDPWAGRRLSRSVTSGCGKGTNFERNVATISRRRLGEDRRLRVRPAEILGLVAELHARSALYRVTRGCHNAALCGPEGMLLFREDIGRHNAIDMIIGHCFEHGVPTGERFIVSTGRVASEILLKVVRMGIPMLVSTAVATSFSVDLARRTGVTLVGNAGTDSFWVYNDPGRIVELDVAVVSEKEMVSIHE
ncbi:MAG: formate dehydrogenase accessory sulfurtransferase FdhD [Desulfovibrionaceae bacterium]